MKESDLKKLIEDKEFLKSRISEYSDERIIRIVSPDKDEILGHVEKARHNLEFVKDNLKLGYSDWCTTGCYYAVYHAALALILSKGYLTKSHDATLCILIKEFYKQEISFEDIELINKFFLDYQDILFYVQSKKKREEATYSTKLLFDKPSVETLRIKAILFVDKIKNIIG